MRAVRSQLMQCIRSISMTVPKMTMLYNSFDSAQRVTPESILGDRISRKK